MRKNLGNEKVLRAMTIGLTAMMAVTATPMTVLADTNEPDPSSTEDPANKEEYSSSEAKIEVEELVAKDGEITAAETANGKVDSDVEAVEAIVDDKKLSDQKAAIENIKIKAAEVTNSTSAAETDVKDVAKELGDLDTVINGENGLASVVNDETEALEAQEEIAVAAASDAKTISETAISDLEGKSTEAEGAATVEDAQRIQQEAWDIADKALEDLKVKEKAYEDAVEAYNKAKEEFEAKKTALIQSANSEKAAAAAELESAKADMVAAQGAAEALAQQVSDAKAAVDAAELTASGNIPGLEAEVSQLKDAYEKMGSGLDGFDKCETVEDFVCLLYNCEKGDFTLDYKKNEGVYHVKGNKGVLGNNTVGAVAFTKGDPDKSYWNSKETDGSNGVGNTKVEGKSITDLFGSAAKKQAAYDAWQEKDSALTVAKTNDESLKALQSAYVTLQEDAAEAQTKVDAAKEKVDALQDVLDNLSEYPSNANTIEALENSLEIAKQNYDAAVENKEKIQEKLEDVREAVEKRTEELNSNNGGGGELPGGGTTGGGELPGGGTPGGTTGGGTAPAVEITVLPVAAAPATGVLGVRAPRTTAAKATTKVAAADTEEADGKEVKEEVKAPATKEEKKEVKEETKKPVEKKVVTLAEEEVPLAEAPEKEQMSWWWLLLIAILGATGYAIYRKNKEKKEEKAAIANEINKN